MNLERFLVCRRPMWSSRRKPSPRTWGSVAPVLPPPPSTSPAFLLLVMLASVVCNVYGAGCEFPQRWSGRWFQSGTGVLLVNRTHIESKGECYDSQGDKYMIHDRVYDCYRCLAIHEKHHSVLQYKETYCEEKMPLAELCYSITGDASLFSMFRKEDEDGEPGKPVPCPFKQAPFTFTYNRGSGDCSNPPSRAESCTDDSRLVLKYQACPDVQSTESNVEELVCLATWKEGSTRYLVGRLSQPGRRSSLVSDEDQYRCFIYERVATGRVSYNVAQSGDATCNGLANALEGSRTMRLTTADSHHNKCRFPAWITDHHTWLSLDHRRVYKFSQRNATLKITAEPVNGHVADPADFVQQSSSGAGSTTVAGEVRVVCHSILQSQEQRRVQIVAHITAGCDSGYMCMVFHRRDTGVIEIQQSGITYENTDDACRYFDSASTPYATLITPTLHSKRCPHLGRFTALSRTERERDSRKRRRQAASAPGGEGDDGTAEPAPAVDCLPHDYEALAVGCSGSHETMEFRSTCAHQPVNAYSCHGSWYENHTHYVIVSPVARRSTDALRYCLVYTFSNGGAARGPVSPVVNGGSVHATLSATHPAGVAGSGADVARHTIPAGAVMHLSGVAETCHRHIVPGTTGIWALNFTTNGTCARTNSVNGSTRYSSSMLLLILMLLVGPLIR